jgi:hypothetical protein
MKEAGFVPEIHLNFFSKFKCLCCDAAMQAISGWRPTIARNSMEIGSESPE